MNAITPLPCVPLPVGAEWPDEGVGWQEDDPPRQPYRVIYGVSLGIPNHDLIVWTSAVQYADGRINVTDDRPRVYLDFAHTDDGLSSTQARQLAAALQEAADEIDGWATR